MYKRQVLRWFGWRRLPTARPTSPERAIHWPSAQSAANTCTMPISVPSTPATIHATKKACSADAPARDPADTKSAEADNSPSADRPSPAGSEPGSQDHKTQAATTPCAARSGRMDAGPPEAGAQVRVIATTQPQSAIAASWLNNVGDGGRLKASSVGKVAAADNSQMVALGAELWLVRAAKE